MARKHQHDPVATGDDSGGISNYLEPLTAMASAASGADKEEISVGQYRRESKERMTEAGGCLRQWLLRSADSTVFEKWQNLTAGEKECIAMATSLRALEATIGRRAREHATKREQQRKANRKLRPWPTVSRGAFDRVGSEPGSPAGVLSETRNR
jgi:hypothetical protein